MIFHLNIQCFRMNIGKHTTLSGKNANKSGGPQLHMSREWLTPQSWLIENNILLWGYDRRHPIFLSLVGGLMPLLKLLLIILHWLPISGGATLTIGGMLLTNLIWFFFFFFKFVHFKKLSLYPLKIWVNPIWFDLFYF